RFRFIDAKMKKCNSIKEKISHTICMDATNEETVTDLPLQYADIVMICIGEDQGVNVMTTALFKNLNVKRIISRSINTLHENVLKAIGVEESVRPEEETAERWAKKLCLRGVVDCFELNKNYSIVEIKTHERFVRKSVGEIGIRKNFNLVILTILKHSEQSSFLGKTKTITNEHGIPQPDTVLETDDILVIYGYNKDLQKLMKYENE